MTIITTSSPDKDEIISIYPTNKINAKSQNRKDAANSLNMILNHYIFYVPMMSSFSGLDGLISHVTQASLRSTWAMRF